MIATITSLKTFWLSQDYTPQEAFTVTNGYACNMLDKHASIVGLFWADAEWQAEFLSMCADHGVTCNVVDGLPVFPFRLPYTRHNDGTITINA